MNKMARANDCPASLQYSLWLSSRDKATQELNHNEYRAAMPAKYRPGRLCWWLYGNYFHRPPSVFRPLPFFCVCLLLEDAVGSAKVLRLSVLLK